jgi:hypothetical protein
MDDNYNITISSSVDSTLSKYFMYFVQITEIMHKISVICFTEVKNVYEIYTKQFSCIIYI